MHFITRFGASVALALLVAGTARTAAGSEKPYEPMRPYIATSATATSCYVGPTANLCIPVDSTFTTAMFSSAACSGPANPADPCSRNDDDFAVALNLPFTFHLYGQAYTQLYLNNNGNLSFNGGYCAFTSTGFPVSGYPMVAPFWADVDTRNTASGVVHYRLDQHKLIVAWDHVGYYSDQADKVNTFEVILSDGTDPAVSRGNNVCMCYGDMQWTTGSASGGLGGFGGTAATVGINAGDGINFFQIGRFDHAGADYDGPGGVNDGVDYLDNQRFCANVSGVNPNIPPVALDFPSSLVDSVCVGDTLMENTSFAAPEVGQTVVTSVDLAGLANATVSTISGTLSTQRLTFLPVASQAGTHMIRYMAVDDGAPPETTVVDLAIVVTNCHRCLPSNHAPQFIAPTPACGSTIQGFVNQAVGLQVAASDAESLDVVTLSATGIPGAAVLTTTLPAMGNPVGTQFSWTPTAADTGLHLVTFLAGDGCDSTACTFTINVLAQRVCPKTAEYWEDHRAAWPVDSLRLGNPVYGPAKLARFLDEERRGRHERDTDVTTLRLARQLVAAKFNLLLGADAPGIDSLVALADSLIGAHSLPYEIHCDGRGGRDGAEAQMGGDDSRGLLPNCGGGGVVSGCARMIRQIDQITDVLARFNSGHLTPDCHDGCHHGDNRGGDLGGRMQGQPTDAGAPVGSLEFTVNTRPNPFHGSTTIVYTLPTNENVRIALYDLQGRELRVLADGAMSAGEHLVPWDGTDASGQRVKNGVYFYRVIAGQYSSDKKLVVQQ